jgi:hypothetical protein
LQGSTERRCDGANKREQAVQPKAPRNGRSVIESGVFIVKPCRSLLNPKTAAAGRLSGGRKAPVIFARPTLVA